jgi:hypothetical protein
MTWRVSAGEDEVEKLLHDFFEAIRQARSPGVENREINVAQRVELAPAVTAQGHQRDLRWLAPLGALFSDRHGEEMPEPIVHHVRAHTAQLEAALFLSLLLEPSVLHRKQTRVLCHARFKIILARLFQAGLSLNKGFGEAL